MNPLHTFLAFLGGRTIAECQTHKAAGCDRSIAIGIATGLGLVVIVTGQYLLIHNLGATPAWAAGLAAGLAVLYTVCYRLMIRAKEVLGAWIGLPIAVLAIGMVGTNAMLAGHEVVMLAFAPQITAVGINEAADGINTLRQKTADALGIGSMQAAGKTLTASEDKLLTALNQVPANVASLRSATSQCETNASILRNRLPAADHDDYPLRIAAWRAERARCVQLGSQAKSAHQAYVAPLQEALGQTRADAARNRTQLTAASGRQATAIAQNQAAIEQANTIGMARHGNLWKAVEQNKVPLWAVAGLMLIALTLEGLGLLLGFLWPRDGAASTRHIEAKHVQLDHAMEMQYLNAMAGQVRPAMRAHVRNFGDADLRQHADTVLTPALHTRAAASAFHRAAHAAKPQSTDTHAQPAAYADANQVLRHLRAAAQGAKHADIMNPEPLGKQPPNTQRT